MNEDTKTQRAISALRKTLKKGKLIKQIRFCTNSKIKKIKYLQ